METRTFNVYSFDELSKFAQDKAITRYIEGNEMEFLSDDMGYWLDDRLEKEGIKEIGKLKIYYSLSCSQGDGAMFEGEFEWKGNLVSISQDGRYYHFNSKKFDITDICDEKASDETYKEFNSLYTEICKDMEKYGYAYIDNENDHDNVAENLRINGYMFTEDGTINY